MLGKFQKSKEMVQLKSQITSFSCVIPWAIFDLPTCQSSSLRITKIYLIKPVFIKWIFPIYYLISRDCRQQSAIEDWAFKKKKLEKPKFVLKRNWV